MLVICAVYLFFYTEVLSAHVPHYKPNTEIIGGDEATAHEAPYAAYLRISTDDSSSYCGGSLVKGKYILTAKHCLRSATQVTVLLGVHNVDEQEESRVIIPFLGKNKFKPHPNSYYDVSLIDLGRTVPENDYVKYAKLPPAADATKTYEGEKPTAYGWGRTSDAANSASSVLRKVILTVGTYNQTYAKDHEIGCFNPFDWPKVKRICHGDSGSPLVLDGVTVGVASHSPKPCKDNYPSYFFKVASIVDWINEQS